MTGPDQVAINSRFTVKTKGLCGDSHLFSPQGSWATPQAPREGGNAAKRTSLPSQTQSLRRKSETLRYGTGTLGEQT